MNLITNNRRQINALFSNEFNICNMGEIYGKKEQALSIVLSVVFSVFLVSVFVYGATTIDSNVSTGNASTTGYIAIGSDAQDDNDVLNFDARNENITWDNDASEFTVTDDWAIDGNASTTGWIAIGSDDQGDDDILFFDGRAENFTWSDSVGSFLLSDEISVATSTATTAAQIFVGNVAGTATSSIIIGDKGLKGCLELWDGANPVRTYANDAALITEVGRCNDD